MTVSGVTAALFLISARADPLYPKGAVATAHPLASRAGERMLELGGNAVDAAVAAAFTLAVVKPMKWRAGRGWFRHQLRREGEEDVGARLSRDGAGARQPRHVPGGKASKELSRDGGLSVAVPGAVAGYLELLEQHGRLKRSQVLAPAIQAARDGFRVGPQYAEDTTERASCLAKDADAARIFLQAGAAPKVGTLLKQPELAATLEAISKRGAKAFYEGAKAKAIADTVRGAGGVLDEADLKAFRTREREPLWGEYRGHRIAAMPPPSVRGGVVVLQTLALLESYGPDGLASREVGVLHRYIEALRRSYVDRTRYLGDPAFVKVPLELLLSKAHLAELEQSIDPKRATPSSRLVPDELKAARPGSGWDAGFELTHTAHVSAVDGEGNAVALTTTINWIGSCLVAKGTGVVLNDEMDDFFCRAGRAQRLRADSGEANAVAPEDTLELDVAHARLSEGTARRGAAGDRQPGRLDQFPPR